MNRRARAALLIAALAVIGVLWAAPLYWMFISGFKTEAEITSQGTTFWPERWTTANFRAVGRKLARPALNSLVVSGACTALIVLFSSLAGYALAKRQFLGRGTFLALVIGTMLVPPSVLIIPLYCIIKSFGLYDSLTGLVVPFGVTAFGIFLMRQYIKEVPDELLESAQLDGCNEWTIFWRIVVPLVKPAIAVLAIIEFVNNWNSFTVPLVLIESEQKETLQLRLATILDKFEATPWSEVMAGAALSVLPVMVLFILFQRRIIRSVMEGALKG